MTASVVDPALSATVVVERYRIYRYLTTFIGLAFLVAVTWVPLQAIEPIVSELAGKDTNINGVLNVSIAISITLLLTLAGTGFKIVHQGKELRRQRDRIVELEMRLLERPLDRAGTGRKSGGRNK